jgi:thiamine biosynthesis lipoprotein
MGTVFSFDVRTPGFDTTVLDDAVDILQDIDARFSTFRDDSEVSRLAAGTLRISECSEDVQWVLRRCAELTAETDGYFSAYAGGALDPSGLVKGWAIEQASDLLCMAGSTSHCVNGGGDVQCVGWAGPDTPWRVGVSHPLRRGELATVVTGTDLAVATSGSAERGAHVVDPHTRRAPGALASVTLIGRHLSDVDAYATAAFAMDDAARGWLESLDGFRAFVVQADGATWSTGF